MLRKTGEKWEFESELALENFAWANLESLFGLTALKRQYYSNGEISDILARLGNIGIQCQGKNGPENAIQWTTL